MSDLGVEMLAATMGFDSSDKLFFKKITAVLGLIPRINGYANQLFDAEHLVYPLAMKKIEQIKGATSEKELDSTLALPKVHRCPDGTYGPANDYMLPEEELIGWSIASLKAPLPDAAFQRYMDLFSKIFPEYTDKIGI